MISLPSASAAPTSPFPPPSSSVSSRLTVHFADNTTTNSTRSHWLRRRQITRPPDSALPSIHLRPSPSTIPSRFTGKYAYRGLIPMSDAVEALGPVARRSHMIWGYDGHLICFPVEQGRTLNVVAFRTQLPAQHTMEGRRPMGPPRYPLLRPRRLPRLVPTGPRPPLQTQQT